jgi:hypothetical protein
MSQILDRHKGKPAIIAMHGPSLTPYIQKIKGLKESGYLIFGCNEWYYIYATPPDFWCLANTVNTVVSEKRRMNEVAGRTIICYADSVDTTPRAWVEQNLLCDYLPYDQKHFNALPCYLKKCCEQLIPGRPTIQEALKKYTGHNRHYGCGATVALHTLTMAILCGCNPIYVVGMDLDYKLGYAQNSGNMIHRIDSVNNLTEFREDIIVVLCIINDSAKKIGVKVFNLNPNSTFSALEKAQLP